MHPAQRGDRLQSQAEIWRKKSEPNSMPWGPCKPLWDLHGMNRAELSHPAVVASDPLCRQICPPLSCGYGHPRLQGTGTSSRPLHMGQGNMALNWGPGTQAEEGRVFDGVRTAALRLHHGILMAEGPRVPPKHRPSIQQTFSRGQAMGFSASTRCHAADDSGSASQCLLKI